MDEAHQNVVWRCEVLSVVISKVSFARPPVYLELSFLGAFLEPIESHIYLFGSFLLIFLLDNPMAVDFSTCIGVGGYNWFISMIVFWMVKSSCAMT